MKQNSEVLVNLKALKKNVSILRSRIADETKIMAVVKANAYGHGAVRIAETLEPLVKAFAVNDIREGIELREYGIVSPILVFGVPDKSTASQYRMHNLTATISANEHFDLLPNGTSYHINFDTGMGRLGFLPREAEQVSVVVKEHPELFCTGLYTHFATAEEPDSEYVDQQYNTFKTVTDYFPPELSKHIANTGAASFYSFDKFDMVRLGIGLYGYPPGNTEIEGLKPVLGWNSRLVEVKKITQGSAVSYGATWEAAADGYLGVIPVGYDDGLKRNLTSGMRVRINADIYDVVGTITMNYCMIFLGDRQLKPGTEVELLYDDQNALHWANKLDTIPYEILTSIDEKIPRKYV